MSTTFEQLRALDLAMLTDVVRQDQRDPDFEITEWAVRRLSDRGFASEDGPFCFYGHGRSGPSVRSWSVVLKFSATPQDTQLAPTSLWCFKREWLVYQADLPDTLPAALAVPRCYSILEQVDGTWVWMEHVIEKNDGRWGAEEFAFAARELGRFGGAYATSQRNPDQPWLSRNQIREWIAAWSPENVWDSVRIQRLFPPQIRARVFRLWDERERFMAVLDDLPQAFSHFDCMRRNLLIRDRPGGDELVAVDWAMCGMRPLGSDLSHLVAQSAAFCDWDPAHVAELERATEGAYLAGLSDAGWRGEPQIIRLGFTAWTALWMGVTLPRGVAMFAAEERWAFLQQKFNRTPEEFAAGWVALCEYALDRADEARQIMTGASRAIY